MSFLSVKQVAERWGVDYCTAWEFLSEEPGVIDLNKGTGKKKRLLRVPPELLEKIEKKRTLTGFQLVVPKLGGRAVK